MILQHWAFGLYALVTISGAMPNAPLSMTMSLISPTANTSLAIPTSGRSYSALATRATRDPACPDGWICDFTEGCPSPLACSDGYDCFTAYAETQIEYVCLPRGITTCSVNADHTLAYIAQSNQICCHGDIYHEGTECCNFPDIQCTLTGDYCGACKEGSTCGASSCITSTVSTTTTTMAPTSVSTATMTTTSVSTATTSSAATPTATVVQVVDTYYNIGCYADSGDARALDGDSITGNSETTVEKCVEFAKANGWKYAGVEFGSECWVGNTLNTADQFADSDCAQLCEGDATEYCGSGGRIQIYEDTSTTPAPAPQKWQKIDWIQDEGKKCDDSQKAMVEEELERAIAMAQSAQLDLKKGIYFDKLFPESLKKQGEDFDNRISERYGQIITMLASGRDEGKLVRVSCNPQTPRCLGGDMAAMGTGSYIMNFCPKFFEEADPANPNPTNPKDKRLWNTASLVNQCSTLDLRTAQRSKAAIIIHECMHTPFVIGIDKKTVALDYTYGYEAILQLPLGTFNRGCSKYADYPEPKCPDPKTSPDPDNIKDGICAAELAELNADTYSFLAAGAYFSEQCKRAIPLPSLTTETSAVKARAPATTLVRRLARSPPVSGLEKRAESCPAPDPDIIIVDDGPDYDDDGDDGGDTTAITGHVHFGDSFASGMGAGITSEDSCRIGSNNYGKLLRDYFAGQVDDYSFELHSCSGDTIDGLNFKVDEWSNAAQASFATLTIGGNDLGFSDIVWYCVITPNTLRFGSTNRAYCEDAENRARSLMQSGQLQEDLTGAYLKILSGATSPNFRLYVTGYPTFFNDETSDCDRTSFHYFWGGYNAPTDWPTYRTVFLTTSLRQELNQLVTDLNTIIQAAVNDANQRYGATTAYYVSVEEAFAGHRWCEDGVHEPDSRNAWFFLSNWPDLQYNSAAQESDEVAALFSLGSIPIPDAGTCNDDLASQPDPYDWVMCRTAKVIAEDPDGPEAARLARANAAIAAGDVSSQDVTTYASTNKIKTFHPRTPGMYAFRDAVIKAMEAAGQI